MGELVELGKKVIKMTPPRFVASDDAILKEVIDRDCYGVSDLKPFPAVVIDGGACFGAFSLLCWSLGAKRIEAYEPHPLAFRMLRSNIIANPGAHNVIHTNPVGLSLTGGVRHFCGDDIGHPCFGPHPGFDAATIPLPMPPLANWVSLLKLDVEGAERELFAYELTPVIADYDYVVMEWHNHDGALYATILQQLDFDIVRLEGGDRTPWNPTIGGGILIARGRSLS